MRKAVEEIEEAAESALQGRPDRSSESHRRGKGDKANKKQMAAVGAVYMIKPFVRTADDVIGHEKVTATKLTKLGYLGKKP